MILIQIINVILIKSLPVLMFYSIYLLYHFLYKFFVCFSLLSFVTLVVSFGTRETLNGKISNNLQEQIDSYLEIVMYKMYFVVTHSMYSVLYCKYVLKG